MTDRHLPDLEQAAQQAAREFRRNAERTYAELDRMRKRFIDRVEKLRKRIEELTARLADQAQRAVTEGSKAAADQVQRIRGNLSTAQKELDTILKDQEWLSDDFRNAAMKVYKASIIDKTLTSFAEELGRRTGKKAAPKRKAAAKKRPARKKKAAAKKKVASKKKAPSKKKAVSKKKAASKKKAPSKKKAVSKKKAG